MKSIETKYVGPSNVRGSRYIATDGDNRVIVSANYALNSEQNHIAAARSLCNKLNWHGSLWGGHTKAGMVFVWADSDVSFSVIGKVTT